MVWGAIAMGAIGLGTSLVKGNEQRQAADAQNKQQKKMIKDRYKRDKKEWKLNYLQSQSDYAWQMANTEAQRYQDRVRKEDYEAQQERIIDSALLNLELNTEALRDQYITSERLRALQVTNELEDNLAGEQITLDNALATARYDAGDAMLKSMDDVAGYINSIKQRGQQADQLLAAKQSEGTDIQEQIVIGEQLDTLQRDAQYIVALVEGADKKAGAVARSGGSNSARRVAMDSMKAFGRSYGELQLQQRDRRRKLNSYNASLSGETAAQLAQMATAIENEARGIKYTKASNQLQLSRIGQRAMGAQAAFNLNTGSLMRNYEQLTRPSFDLAQRQGEREYQALVSSTINTIKGAETPYREAIIFDPLEPIAGLKPEKAAFTPVAKPSWGSILTGAAVNAASGAMGMSYTKADGSLGFR